MKLFMGQSIRRLSGRCHSLYSFLSRLIWGWLRPPQQANFTAVKDTALQIWGDLETLQKYKAHIPWEKPSKLKELRVSWADTKEERFGGQFGIAYSDLVAKEIRIYRNNFRRLLGSRYLLEILAHEFGHPLEIPSLRLEHYNSLNVILKREISAAQKRQFIFNLFADVVINTDLIQLRRRWRRNHDIEEVYRRLSSNNSSKLWMLYMTLYERLWKVMILSRKDRRRARRNIDTDDINLLVDCTLRCTSPHADWSVWAREIVSFARIVDKYMDEEAFKDVVLIGMRNASNIRPDGEVSRGFTNAMKNARASRHKFTQSAQRLSEIRPNNVQSALEQMQKVISEGQSGASAEAIDSMLDAASQACSGNPNFTGHIAKLRRVLSAGNIQNALPDIQSVGRALTQHANQYNNAAQTLRALAESTALEETPSQQGNHKAMAQALEKLLQQVERLGDEECLRQAQGMRDKFYDDDIEAVKELAETLQGELAQRQQQAQKANDGLQDMAESQMTQSAEFEDLLRRLTHAANKIAPGREQRLQEKHRPLQESLDEFKQAVEEANETANEQYAEEQQRELEDAQEDLERCEEVYRQQVARKLTQIQDRVQWTLEKKFAGELRQALNELNNALSDSLRKISQSIPKDELLRELEKLKKAGMERQRLPLPFRKPEPLLKDMQELEKQRDVNPYPNELLRELGDIDVDYLDDLRELEELMRQAEEMAKELELRRIGDVFHEISRYIEKEPETPDERQQWQEGKQEIYQALETQADRMDVRDFMKLAGFAGVRDSVEANIWFYRARARHKIYFPEPPDSDMIFVNAGVDRWHPDKDPFHRYDAVRTVQQYGVQIPGSTTLKARHEKIKTNLRTGELEKVPDLEIWLDSSGSMPNPTANISDHVISTMVATHCAINADAKVKIINYSGEGNCFVVDFTDDLDHIDRATVKYYGSGTVVPIEAIRKSYEENRNQKRYYIFTTDAYLHNLEKTISALKEIFEIDVPSYKRRCFGWTVFLQGEGGDKIKRIQDALGDEKGENVLEARPEIIDQRTLQIAHGIYLKRNNPKKSFCF